MVVMLAALGAAGCEYVPHAFETPLNTNLHERRTTALEIKAEKTLRAESAQPVVVDGVMYVGIENLVSAAEQVGIDLSRPNLDTFDIGDGVEMRYPEAGHGSIGLSSIP